MRRLLTQPHFYSISFVDICDLRYMHKMYRQFHCIVWYSRSSLSHLDRNSPLDRNSTNKKSVDFFNWLVHASNRWLMFFLRSSRLPLSSRSHPVQSCQYRWPHTWNSSYVYNQLKIIPFTEGGIRTKLKSWNTACHKNPKSESCNKELLSDCLTVG